MSEHEIDTVFLNDAYRRIAAQDPSAMNDLLDRVNGRLERLTRKMLHGFPGVHRWEDTSDVMQSALVKLFRSLEQVRPESTRAFIGFAAEQIRRTLIDLARHYQGPQGHGANHASGVMTHGPDSDRQNFDVPDAGSGDDNLDLWYSLHQAVAKLPVAEREVFSLSFYHGWKQAEIANLMQVSERTVRRFWTSACDLLKQTIGRELPWE